jgi:farnesyl diphosphate synthase
MPVRFAFQIADDILDVEGDEAQTGKRLRKDGEAGKATFVSLLGLDGARKEAARLVETACEALSGHGAEADCLRQAARFVISRQS